MRSVGEERSGVEAAKRVLPKDITRTTRRSRLPSSTIPSPETRTEYLAGVTQCKHPPRIGVLGSRFAGSAGPDHSPPRPEPNRSLPDHVVAPHDPAYQVHPEK